ncbi:MAG: glycosyltransferase family 2 protein [Acidobacteria bacterium]|nr:glycosyltransferase family 2 protein [Acidobacteriota bacterium]
MSRVSIVIVNYRSGRELASCLRSLVRNAGPLDYGVFVVNNDRPEDLSPLSDLDTPRVHVVQNRSNRGFAAAANQGYRQSRGSFLLLLNPDVRVEAGALEILADTLERHADAGVVLPRLNSPDGSLQHSCRRFYTLATLLMRRAPFRHFWPNHPSLRRHLMADWDRRSLSEVDWGLGAAMLVRRAATESNALMDERFFLYFEDVDLCKSMWDRGWKVLYNPAACMVHSHRRDSARGWRLGAKRHHLFSLLKFLWKHRFRLGRGSQSGRDP